MKQRRPARGRNIYSVCKKHKSWQPRESHINPHRKKHGGQSQTHRFSLFADKQTVIIFNNRRVNLCVVAWNRLWLSAQSAFVRGHIVRGNTSRVATKNTQRRRSDIRGRIQTDGGKTYEWKQPPWGEGCLLQQSRGGTRVWKCINFTN